MKKLVWLLMVVSAPALAQSRGGTDEWSLGFYAILGPGQYSFEGGATAFPDLGLSLRVGPGDLLVFRDSGPDQQPDLRMRHAGEPVTAGEKWIATRWIRHGPHDSYDRG